MIFNTYGPNDYVLPIDHIIRLPAYRFLQSPSYTLGDNDKCFYRSFDFVYKEVIKLANQVLERAVSAFEQNAESSPRKQPNKKSPNMRIFRISHGSLEDDEPGECSEDSIATEISDLFANHCQEDNPYDLGRTPYYSPTCFGVSDSFTCQSATVFCMRDMISELFVVQSQTLIEQRSFYFPMKVPMPMPFRASHTNRLTRSVTPLFPSSQMLNLFDGF